MVQHILRHLSQTRSPILKKKKKKIHECNIGQKQKSKRGVKRKVLWGNKRVKKKASEVLEIFALLILI